MGKLITIKETAQRLGFTEQTVKNWDSNGFISIKSIGKARYIDEDTINALSDSLSDIEAMKRKISAYREELSEELRENEERRANDRFRKTYTNFLVGAAFRSGFFKTVVRLMVSYGSLKERDAHILIGFLEGRTLESMKDDYGITRERVRQIVEKAIRKSSDITNLEYEINKSKEVAEENAILKNTINGLRENMKAYESHKGSEKADNALCKLLSTKLADCDLSVRALSGLIAGRYGIVPSCYTIGDLCRLKREDLFKIRNMGKKTIFEIEEFLESHNLSFGMDVDSIFADYEG